MLKEHLEKAFQRTFLDSHDNWKGLCPFHDERTPSFLVHKTEYVANCFGCGTSGYIDVLLAKYKGIPLRQASAMLDITVEERVKNKLKRTLVKPIYFPESWLAGWKKEIHKYVIERGFDTDTLKYAETRYDKGKKRQVFVHRDRQGRLLGAIGRSCRGEDPKWYFYWDYRKGQSLWTPRWEPFQQEIQKQESLILVEGVFDALWLIQQGYKNTAATLGATVSKEQLQQARQLSKKIRLGFDRDEAGARATEKVYRGLRKTHQVEFLDLPEGTKDWMDLNKEQIDRVMKESKNSVQRRIISKSKESSRVSSKQKESRIILGTGNRKNNNFNCCCGQTVTAREGTECSNCSPHLDSLAVAGKN